MHTANLRKVGGSVMLAVPPTILEILNMDTGTAVTMEVENGRLIVAHKKQKKYTLQELLSKCDENAPLSDEDREWVNGSAQGRELL